LIEQFTTVSSDACATFNSKFNPLLLTNDAKISVLKYHVSSNTGNDPMNQSNKIDALARSQYYAVSNLPASLFDGITKTQTQALLQTTFDQALANNNAPFEMSASHSFDSKMDSVFITVKVKNSTKTDFTQTNQVLQVVIAERVIQFPSAPGINKEKIFYDVMRKMLPNNKGTAFPTTIKAGEELTFKIDAALPIGLYDLSQISIVTFVQNSLIQSINQSATSKPIALLGDFVDAELTNITVPKDMCEANIAPKVRLKNNGNTPLTSANLYYIHRTKKSEILNWKGNLKKGESVEVTFPIYDFIFGRLVFSVTNPNEDTSRDYSSLNNTTMDYYLTLIPPNPIGPELKYGFEFDAAGLPPKSALTILEDPIGYFYVADKTIFSNPPSNEIGGYGLSKKSFMFPYYEAYLNQIMGLVFYKIDLKEKKNIQIQFDYAYAQYLSSGVTYGDKFEVLASTDCGKTFKTYFSKEKDKLATTQPQTSLFKPKSTEWKTEKISANELDGKSEALIMFRGVSGKGNLLFLDNVSVDGELSVAVEDLLEGVHVTISPNPASDFAYINMNWAENTQASVRVFDMTGKQVSILAQEQDFTAGENQLLWDTQNTAAGIYMVKIETTKGQITKRLAVFK
jgi:hypothetical protein